MPRVPMPEGPQVQLGAMPQVRLAAPEISDVGSRQVQGFGQALEGAGQVLGKAAQQEQDKADEFRVLEAMNRAKEQQLALQYGKDGYTSVAGKAAFDRPDGKSLEEYYGEQLGSRISEISNTLGNDRQRAVFQKAAGEMMFNFREGVARHELGQRKVAFVAENNGIISTGQNEILQAAQVGDWTAVKAATERIRDAVMRKGEVTGEAGKEWHEATSRDLVSSAHRQALAGMLDARNLDQAKTYLEKFGPQMAQGDLMPMRAKVMDAISVQRGELKAQAAFTGSLVQANASGRPVGFDAAVAHVLKTEGGFVANDAGKGATNFGINKTANPDVDVAGLTPEKAAGIYKQRYWDAIDAEKLPPDMQLMAFDAAVNQGVGNAKKWLAQAGGDAQKFLDLRRQHYQSLLTSNPGKYGPYAKSWANRLDGITQTLASPPGRVDLLTAMQRLESDPDLALDARAMKAARESLTRQHEQYTKGVKQRGEEATASAMQALLTNGGRFNELPTDVVGAVPPEKVDDLMAYAERIAKGQEVKTSPALYQRLTENPEYLKGLSEAQFFALRTELSDSDFKHFTKERAKLSGKSTAGDLNSAAIKSNLDVRLHQLGIDPTPKDESKEAQRVGTIRKFVNDYFFAAQRDAGGKTFNDAEVSQHLDALFAKNVQFRNTFMGISGPINQQQLMSMKPSDIPDNTRQQIVAAMKRQGNTNPTDEQVLETYWRMRTTAR